MKKLEKKIDDVMNSLAKDQSVFAMCANDEGKFFYSYCMNGDEIGAGIATILCDWFISHEKYAERAAKGILDGLKAAIKHDDVVGRAIISVLAPAAAERVVENLKRLRKELEDALDNDEEDCEHCEHNRDCQHPSAIKYRKANGIPAPKKRAKKHCNEKEQGS